MARGVSVGLCMHAPVAIVAVRVHVSAGVRAVSHEFSRSIDDHACVRASPNAGFVTYDNIGYGHIRYSFRDQLNSGIPEKSLLCLKQFRQTFVHKCFFVL